MAWKGKDRREHIASFSGLERRAEDKARLLADASRLPAEQVRELANQRRREQAENWEASEYLE